MSWLRRLFGGGAGGSRIYKSKCVRCGKALSKGSGITVIQGGDALSNYYSQRPWLCVKCGTVVCWDCAYDKEKNRGLCPTCGGPVQ